MQPGNFTGMRASRNGNGARTNIAPHTPHGGPIFLILSPAYYPLSIHASNPVAWYSPQFVEQLDITDNTLFFGKKVFRLKVVIH
jgi:hypothetical protein